MPVGMDLRLKHGLEKTSVHAVEVLLPAARPAVQDCYNYVEAYLSHHGGDDVVCNKILGSSSCKITFCLLMATIVYKYTDDWSCYC